MALINITGGKYTTRALSAAATTTVTVGTATFVAGDFNPTQRMVALFTSAGAFKGIAWVRRFVSTTQLELENQFVDPVTGLFATQAVGDNLMVSRNSSETANTADWVVSGIPLSVTTNDALTFGTTNTTMSVCFYEENMDFNTRSHVRVVGGVVVFGKLVSYDGVSKESFLWTRECNIKPRSDYLGGGTGGGNAVQYNVYPIGTTAGHAFMFGGMVGGSYQASNFIGSEGLSGLASGSFAFFGTRLNYGCSSPGNGGNWPSNASRHLLYKTIHEARYNNANLVIWGNGDFQGSYLAFPQIGTGSPLGIFRANSVYNVGASTNNRTVVSDLGSGAFIDAINGGDYRFTNVITPAVTVVRHPGSARPIQFSFSDDYTNLKPRTTLVVRRTAGSVIASSVVNTSNSTFTATVLQSTYSATGNGAATQTANYTSFGYTVKCYGYGVVSGTHSTVVYPLGTAGNGTDLKLGGLINQVEDTGVTLTETNALALSSKITINSGTSTITVTGNATLDELYDYAVAWGCSSAANAVIPNLSQYLLTYTGTQLTAPAGWTLVVNNGITLSAGAKYDYIFVPTVTLTGTGRITAVYASNAGTSTIWRFEDVAVGSSIIVYDSSGVTKYFQQNITTAGDYNYYIPPGTTGTYTWAIEKYGTQRQSGSFAANTGGLLFYAPIYVEDVGITQTVQATVAAYTAIDNLDKFYDFTAFRRLSEDFIKIGQIATRSGTAVEIGNFNLTVNASAGAMESISGLTITIKSGSLAPGSKYSTIIATPPRLVTAATTEVITANIEDGAGNSSVTIQGGSGNFTLWKLANATPEADYATGTNLGNVGNVTYRFLSDPGFKIVIVDNVTGYRIVCPMDKGIYTRGLFFGDQVQLAQSAEVTQINTKMDILTNNVAALPQEIMDTTVETGATVVESLRLHNSVLGGKVSGGGSATETFRDLADTKDRLVSSVTETGNRTAEVYDLT